MPTAWPSTSGWDWTQILDHYYGGTQFGTAGNSPIRVRLMALDNAPVDGVVSTNRTRDRGTALDYGSIQAYEVAPNRYDVYGTADLACPGGGGRLGADRPGGAGPDHGHDARSTRRRRAAGDVLGLCQPDGTVIHYRGSLTATEDGSGANRVVNEVLVENYLRGVLSTGGVDELGQRRRRAGMHALYAMATAARSFALSQHRYSYGDTCDTSTCQVYGGAAYRANADAPTSHPTVRVCETGNLTFECSQHRTGPSPRPPAGCGRGRTGRSSRPSTRRPTGRTRPAARSRRSTTRRATSRRTRYYQWTRHARRRRPRRPLRPRHADRPRATEHDPASIYVPESGATGSC